MQATPQRAHRTKNLVLALLGALAVLPLSAFQFGDRNGLNGLPFAQVQPMVSDLSRAKSLAQQGNIELLAGQTAPGKLVQLRGEITDANCYLGSHTHAYDHAFCAKLCAPAGSPLLFVPDQGGPVYVVLPSQNGVPVSANVLNQIGVPGILVNGKVFDAEGMHTLAVEGLQQ